MVIRIPGTGRRIAFGPLRMAMLLVVLVPLAWALYLLGNLWRVQARIQQGLPPQAYETIVARTSSTHPPLIFPTEKPGKSKTPTAASSSASGDATPVPGPTQPPQATEIPGVPTAYDPSQAVPTPTVTLSTPEAQKSSISDWKGKKRINVMLLGIDQRSDEPTRADTIILASLDFEHNKAYILSIPRDLYVEVPGFNWWKINAAYTLGENPKYRDDVNGGVGLMMRTLRYNLLGGAPIDAYAVVDFQTFVDGVNALDGIWINIPKKIVNNKYPEGSRYTRVVFMPGLQRMDGDAALKYARTRHDSDFGRMRRQQAVILAIQQRARTPATILKAPALLDVLGENVTTSLTLREQIRLSQWGASLPRENIKFYTLEGTIGSAAGQSVVWPKKKDADATLKLIFGPQAGLRHD